MVCGGFEHTCLGRNTFSTLPLRILEKDLQGEINDFCGEEERGEREGTAMTLRFRGHASFFTDLSIILDLSPPLSSHKNHYCPAVGSIPNTGMGLGAGGLRPVWNHSGPHEVSKELIWGHLFKDTAWCELLGGALQEDRWLELGWGWGVDLDLAQGQDLDGMSRKMVGQRLSRSRGCAGIVSQAARQVFRGSVPERQEARTPGQEGTATNASD